MDTDQPEKLRIIASTELGCNNQPINIYTGMKLNINLKTGHVYIQVFRLKN